MFPQKRNIKTDTQMDRMANGQADIWNYRVASIQTN